MHIRRKRGRRTAKGENGRRGRIPGVPTLPTASGVPGIGRERILRDCAGFADAAGKGFMLLCGCVQCVDESGLLARIGGKGVRGVHFFRHFFHLPDIA